MLKLKETSLEEIWPDLHSGLRELILNLNQGFPKERWIKLYS